MVQRYPDSPGHKGTETSADAAAIIAPIAPTYEGLCLAAVEARPTTPDEAHAAIERRLGHRVPLYSIRPRFSALKAKGLIADSGDRRAPAGGCKAVVWRATTAEERALHHARKAAEDRS